MPRENPFPYIVNALTDLPEGFQQAMQACLPMEEAIHSILMLPPQPFMKRGGVPRQAVISTTNGILHIRDGKPPAANYLPAESLLYVRHKLVLLYGGLELAGEAHGKLIRIHAEYNTVGQYLLDDALSRFLQLSHGATDPNATVQEANNKILDALGKESFKFMNGMRLYALQPGERLLGCVFQPRIKEPILRFFNRPIAPASMFALTDRNAILIEEDKVRGASYGWVITLCPRTVILTVESKPMEKWEKLSVLLMKNKANMDQTLILEPNIALACKALWASQASQESEIA
jgi:hypothetical protein